MAGGPTIYLPVGRVYPNPQTRGSSAILSDESHLRDFTAALGGRSAKPRKPVVIWLPDGRTQHIIVGAGYAEAAELEELAYKALEEARETMKRTGGMAHDVDDARERAGLPRREDVGTFMAEAIEAARLKHKHSPVTNPAPEEYHNPRPGNGTLHTVGPQTWKEKA